MQRTGLTTWSVFPNMQWCHVMIQNLAPHSWKQKGRSPRFQKQHLRKDKSNKKGSRACSFTPFTGRTLFNVIPFCSFALWGCIRTMAPNSRKAIGSNRTNKSSNLWFTSEHLPDLPILKSAWYQFCIESCWKGSLSLQLPLGWMCSLAVVILRQLKEIGDVAHCQDSAKRRYNKSN